VESRISLRTLALDVGDRRIGIAVTDRLGLTVQGRPTRMRRGLGADIEHLRSLVEAEGVQKVVVGLPLHMDGRESPQSLKTKAFAAHLQEAIDVPVVFWDERLTSFAAEQELEELGLNWQKRRGRVDEAAATLLLEDFLKDG
jgi:putative Holliday junction resolvase